MRKQRQHLYEFGPFRLDTAERRLWREGDALALTPKAFDTLVVLVERSGQLVEKEELMEALWPDQFVEEANLTNNVWALRKALGEDGHGSGYIETVPKRGYRFTARVRELMGAGQEMVVVEKHTLTRITTEEEQTTDSDEAALAVMEMSHSANRDKRGWPRWRSHLITGLGGGLVIGLAVALSYTWARREPTRGEADVAVRPQLRSMAVLPFKVIGSDSGGSEYLGLGMTDTLITKLGTIRQVRVRPTSAVRRYNDPGQDPIAIGRDQRVDAVLDGSVQRVGERVRVQVQLFRVEDAVLLWSSKFDERLTDILAVQDSISQQVAQGLMVRLSEEEREQFQKRAAINIEAYQAYLKGRYFWNKRSEEGHEKAVEYFNQAISIDPTYAEAYAGLAETYPFIGFYSVASRAEAYATARRAAEKALSLDETLSEAHAALGAISNNWDWDWARAEREYKRAIELNPNYATAHHWYAEYLVLVGRFDEGMTEIKRAAELDPLSLIISTDTGTYLLLGRKYTEAIEQLRKTLEMDPNYFPALFWLGWAYEFEGLHEEAIAVFEKTKRVDNSYQWLSNLGYVYARAGRRSEARGVLNELQQLSKHKQIDPLYVADIYIGLGEKEQAFHWLEKEYEARSVGLVSLRVNPIYDSLRSDPRFTELMRRVGFAQ